MPIAGPGLTRDMTTVGFIGSGNMGGTVARLAVAAGYDVVLSSSRGPQTVNLGRAKRRANRQIPRSRRSETAKVKRCNFRASSCSPGERLSTG